jgi:hypothetical protein
MTEVQYRDSVTLFKYFNNTDTYSRRQTRTYNWPYSLFWTSICHFGADANRTTDLLRFELPVFDQPPDRARTYLPQVRD